MGPFFNLLYSSVINEALLRRTCVAVDIPSIVVILPIDVGNAVGGKSSLSVIPSPVPRSALFVYS